MTRPLPPRLQRQDVIREIPDIEELDDITVADVVLTTLWLAECQRADGKVEEASVLEEDVEALLARVRHLNKMWKVMGAITPEVFHALVFESTHREGVD